METSRVMEIIAEQLNLSVETLSLDTVFEDLGVDSLDLFQVVAALEEEFEIDFDNDLTEQMTTVGEVVDYIKEGIGELE